MVSEPALELRGVSVSYGGLQALRDVSMVVPVGAAVALLGANGAGKSTALRAISGVIRAERGRILAGGQRIERRHAYRIARMGVVHVPEGRGIFPSLTVRENLLMASAALGAAVDPVEEGIALFPVLGTRLSQVSGSLSGGEQQMLALARVMMTRPRLLMIDELALGLAPMTVERLMGMVRRINEEGTTVILVEQSVNRAMSLAERCFFIERGEIRFDGPTAELMQRDDLLRPVFLGAATVGLD